MKPSGVVDCLDMLRSVLWTCTTPKRNTYRWVGVVEESPAVPEYTEAELPGGRGQSTLFQLLLVEVARENDVALLKGGVHLH